MLKGIKKTINIFVAFLSLIAIFLAATPILLNSNKIQNIVANEVVNGLSKKLNTKVSVGKVSYSLFDRIHITDIYLEDQHSDTLLYVKDADAAFRFWDFFKGKVIFKGIELDRLYGNLKIDSTGKSNLDFVIKAFEKKDKTDSSKVEYQIKYLKIKNSAFRIRHLYKNQQLVSGIINPDNIFLNNINSDIRLNILKKDTINAEIKHLNFNERSGLIVDNFTTELNGSATNATIPFIKLSLPQSLVKLEGVEIKYDSIADLKNITKNIKWTAPFRDTYITPSDLGFISPALKRLKGKATIDGLISGKISGLQIKKLLVKYGDSFSLNTDLDVTGLPNLKDAFFFGQINELKVAKSDLQDVVSAITGKPFILSKELSQLGQLSYKGNVTGFLSNLVAYGNLQTNLGSVSTDILLKLENNLQDLSYNGSIKSNGFDIGRMIGNNHFGKLSASLNTNGIKPHDKPFRGEIKATVNKVDINNYAYRDIKFAGKYDGTGFDGNVDIKDENISAQFRGMIDLTKKIPVFDFDMKLDKANLYALNLVQAYKNSDLAFNLKTNMTGNSPDNMNGFIKVDSLKFTNNDKTLNAGDIMFVSRTEKNYTNFNISSNYVNGSFYGNFSYSSFGYTITNIVKHYLPSLSAFIGKPHNQNPNEIQFNLSIDNTQELANIFDIPYYIEGSSHIKGVINEALNKVDIDGNVPLLKANTLKVENITLQIENVKQNLQLTARAQVPDKGGLISMYAIAKAAKDTIATNIGWQNAKQITNAGEVQTVTKFFSNNGKTEARLKIFPSQIIIADSVWDIKPSTVDLRADSSIHINNFLFGHKDQYIHINGIASRAESDSLVVKTNDIDLDYIMNILRLKGISIGGIITGQISIFRMLNKPFYHANLFAKDFMLNHKRIGDGTVTSTWDAIQKHVLLEGVFKNGDDLVAKAKGFYVPKADSIDLNISATKFSVEFLSRYFDGVVDNLKGEASGQIKMVGPMKTINFEGDVLVKNASAKLASTGATYFFTDSVHLKRKAIEFKNMTLFDEDRNRASLNGIVKHDGTFAHMNYDVLIQGKNIIALNTHAEDNEYFFGKAYASGTVKITGNDTEANIIATGTTQPKTKCYIQMGGASTINDNDFIVYVNPVSSTQKPVVKVKIPGEDFNVKVDLRIDVTPDAEMELIVDPKGGDIITGRGSGNLRLQFDTFSDIFLYGNYTLNTGYYLFTFQTLIRKEFKIQNGSTLTWTGDPFGAKMNLQAIYSLTASLTDLMDESEVGNSTTRTNVPVNCVLKLTNDLMKPDINFDIDLPSSDESVKQKVNGIINTEEMMNRQIAYLLVLNKFYNPNYLQSQATPFGMNEAISFGMSTLSSHLTNWVKQAFNTDSWSFGVDWQKSQAYQDEFKAQVLYQPSDRLIVNGNFGYTTDNLSTSTNNNPFSADIDLEYLLTESGKLRFKAFNHTVDRQQLGGTKNSQGVGLIYKEDFSTVSDLINYYFGWLSKRKK